MTRSRYDRLAELMEQRRLDLDLDWKEVAADAGISEATLRAVRNGSSQPSPKTVRGIERGLRWESGSFEAILKDGTPTPRRAPREPRVTGRDEDEFEHLDRLWEKWLRVRDSERALDRNRAKVIEAALKADESDAG